MLEYIGDMEISGTALKGKRALGMLRRMRNIVFSAKLALGAVKLFLLITTRRVPVSLAWGKYGTSI